MIKQFLRSSIGLLLIPCILADPAFAMATAGRPAFINENLFTRQAFALPSAAPLNPEGDARLVTAHTLQEGSLTDVSKDVGHPVLRAASVLILISVAVTLVQVPHNILGAFWLVTGYFVVLGGVNQWKKIGAHALLNGFLHQPIYRLLSFVSAKIPRNLWLSAETLSYGIEALLIAGWMLLKGPLPAAVLVVVAWLIQTRPIWRPHLWRIAIVFALPFFAVVDHELGHDLMHWGALHRPPAHFVVAVGHLNIDSVKSVIELCLHPWLLVSPSLNGFIELGGVTFPSDDLAQIPSSYWTSLVAIRMAGSLTNLFLMSLLLSALTLDYLRARRVGFIKEHQAHFRTALIRFLPGASLALTNIFREIRYIFTQKGPGDWVNASVDWLFRQGFLSLGALGPIASTDKRHFEQIVAESVQAPVQLLISQGRWLMGSLGVAILFGCLALVAAYRMFKHRRGMAGQNTDHEPSVRGIERPLTFVLMIPFILFPLVLIESIRHHPWIHSLGQQSWSTILVAGVFAGLLAAALWLDYRFDDMKKKMYELWPGWTRPVKGMVAAGVGSLLLYGGILEFWYIRHPISTLDVHAPAANRRVSEAYSGPLLAYHLKSHHYLKDKIRNMFKKKLVPPELAYNAESLTLAVRRLAIFLDHPSKPYQRRSDREFLNVDPLTGETQLDSSHLDVLLGSDDGGELFREAMRFTDVEQATARELQKQREVIDDYLKNPVKNRSIFTGKSPEEAVLTFIRLYMEQRVRFLYGMMMIRDVTSPKGSQHLALFLKERLKPFAARYDLSPEVFADKVIRNATLANALEYKVVLEYSLAKAYNPGSITPQFKSSALWFELSGAGFLNPYLRILARRPPDQGGLSRPENMFDWASGVIFPDSQNKPPSGSPPTPRLPALFKKSA